MRAEIQAGVVYLGLAVGIGWLWITGAGAKGVAAIQAAIGGNPDPGLKAKLSIRGYQPPVRKLDRGRVR